MNDSYVTVTEAINYKNLTEKDFEANKVERIKAYVAGIAALASTLQHIQATDNNYGRSPQQLVCDQMLALSQAIQEERCMFFVPAKEVPVFGGAGDNSVV